MNIIRLLTIFLILATSSSKLAFAGFDILESSPEETYYYRASTERDARNQQDNLDDISSSENQRPRKYARGKIAAAYSEAKFKNIRGESDLIQGLVGVGMQWDRYIIDLEVLGSETFFLPKLGPFRANNNALVNLTGDVRPTAIFATFGYYFPTYYPIFPEALRPFVHMGLGFSISSAKLSTVTIAGSTQQRKTINSTAFAWNVGAGITWRFMNNLSLDLLYRVNRFGKIDLGPIQGVDESGHAFLSRGPMLSLIYLHPVQ